MQAYFYHLADLLMGKLQGDEVLICDFEGEDTDFVRLNHNRVRQAGHVSQRRLSLDLCQGSKHAAGSAELAGELSQDLPRLEALLRTLRQQCHHLPEDPYLLYADTVHNSEDQHPAPPPDSAAALHDIHTLAEGLDLVGIWASGSQYNGFANSFGQRNWHSRNSFNFDWSCYHQQDKAVKASLAGFHWQPDPFAQKLAEVREQLALLTRPAKTIDPGQYRVYLAPTALRELVDMMAWGGFGLKSHRTAQTPLIKMIKEGRRLHPAVGLREDHANGLSPRFTPRGFIKPERVELIDAGTYRDCLVSARSAKEYGAAVNAAAEFPESLQMPAGSLNSQDTLAALDTGLYINNLWYCNFSDRSDCRITGMTRFACFWVENGVIQVPVNVMRFDDSIYHILGDGLIGLTAEQALLIDAGSYGQRSTRSYRLPGVLAEGMIFTL